jgi:ADP-ribosylation factor protein 1
MVHYAIESSSTATSEFKQFLVLNPQLSNGGLFLEYYNKDTMLNNPKARSEVVLPDRKPLPSILPQKISNDVSDESKSNIAPMKKQSNLEMSEMEFMQAFENRTLDSWSHNNFVRVIWNVMKEYENAKSSGIPRSKFVDELFSKMQKFMKSDFHLTLTYFWIQIVHISMQTRNVDKFKEFWESSVHLHNQLFHQEFYSTLPIPSSKEMHLPDKKPFPKSL